MHTRMAKSSSLLARQKLLAAGKTTYSRAMMVAGAKRTTLLRQGQTAGYASLHENGGAFVVAHKRQTF